MKYLLVAILFVLGCSARKEYIHQAVKPVPCQVVEWPTIDPIMAQRCEYQDQYFVCLDPQSAAVLAAYIEAVEAWHKSLASCSSVVEVEIVTAEV